MTPLPSLPDLQARYAAACELKQTVDRAKIAGALTAWCALIGAPADIKISFVSSAAEIASAASAARAASAAWAARAASAASAAWAASAARDASAAWAAWDASAARDAWAARAARDASAAREVSWISVTAIGAVSVGEPTARIWLPILEAFEAGAFALFITDAEIFVSTIPTHVAVDESRRLHCATGPAFVWLDNVRDHYWHGVLVEPHVILAPETITLRAIQAEQNAEIRQVLVERYGEERYIRDSGMKPVGSHPKFGDLYVQRFDVGRPIATLFVTNRTAEPDGSFRRYALPINPDLYGGEAGRVPQAAAASTWRTTRGGKTLAFADWRDYDPYLET